MKGRERLALSSHTDGNIEFLRVLLSRFSSCRHCSAVALIVTSYSHKLLRQRRSKCLSQSSDLIKLFSLDGTQSYSTRINTRTCS